MSEHPHPSEHSSDEPYDPLNEHRRQQQISRDEYIADFIRLGLLPNPDTWGPVTIEPNYRQKMMSDGLIQLLNRLDDELDTHGRIFADNDQARVSMTERLTRQARLIGFMASVIRSGESIPDEILTMLTDYALTIP